MTFLRAAQSSPIFDFSKKSFLPTPRKIVPAMNFFAPKKNPATPPAVPALLRAARTKFAAIVLAAAFPLACVPAEIDGNEFAAAAAAESFEIHSLFSNPDAFAAPTDSAAPKTQSAPATTAKFFVSATRVHAGDEAALLVKIEIPRAWHVYWKNPGDAGFPFEIAWKNVPADAHFGAWQWSVPAFFEFQGLAGFGFENQAFVKIPIRFAADAAPRRVTLSGTASWLACDANGCFPQSTDFSVEFEIVPASVAAANFPENAAANGASVANAPAVANAFAEAEKTFPHAVNSAAARATVPAAEIFPVPAEIDGNESAANDSEEFGAGAIDGNGADAIDAAENGALELRVSVSGKLANFANDGKGALPRFFPESEKISPRAASLEPKILSAATDGNSARLAFRLPLADGEFSAAEALGDAQKSGENPGAGVLVFPDGTAFCIAPKIAGVPVPDALRVPDENSAPTAADAVFVPATDAIAAPNAVPAAATNSGSGSDAIFPDFALLALAFLGGLVLNLMPCVFPVLGLKIMHFVAQAGAEKSKIARHGFVFALGVLVSFWILAAALAVLRSGGEELGWGFQLQEPGFVYAMCVVLFVFGLSMSGVFEFGAGATRVGGSALVGKSGLAGTFFSGALAVVVATPCAAPFLAPALGSALAMPLVPSFVLFTAIALGLAAPYVLFACVPALLKFLPKPGAWTETFKQALAFLLYAPALYFFWTLLGQVSDEMAQRDLAISFAAIAAACWIYGKWALPWRSRAVRRAGTVVALAIFAGTVCFAFKTIYPSENSDGNAGGAEISGVADANGWIPWSVEAQTRALDEGKIVYVDFTARWCATCQVNKRVYSDAILREKFAAAGVVKMRADWTKKNPSIATELQKYGRAAVPVNVFLKKGAEPVVLGELFSGAGTVLDGLDEICARRP